MPSYELNTYKIFLFTSLAGIILSTLSSYYFTYNMEFLSNFPRIKSLQGVKQTPVKNKFNTGNLLYCTVRLLAV